MQNDSKLFLNKFKSRYTKDDIKQFIEDAHKLNVTVVGESIVDEYVDGYTLGKSGKSPVVAFEINNIERYEGGILAIRNHLKSFVNDVEIWTDTQSIVKRRYIQLNQKLFETYYYESNNINSYEHIINSDITYICDFGHGFLTKNLRNYIRDISKYIALNVQFNAGNEGLSTIQKYDYAADYICIDEHELRLAFSNSEDTVEDILKNNFKKSVVTITRGEHGCIIYKNGKIYKVPAFTTNVVDAIGAGDTFFAITSLLVHNNVPIDVVGFIGNCAGAIACSYVGNKENVTKDTLIKFIDGIMNE
jgi:bifunctional ADP-heptose synthase (sugar kinase/adenylyltransferase)